MWKLDRRQQILLNIIAAEVYPNGDIPFDSVLKTWLNGWSQKNKNILEHRESIMDDFFNAFFKIQEIFSDFAKLYPHKEDTVLLTLPKVILENSLECETPLMTVVQVLLLDMRRLYPYEIVLDKKEFNNLLFYKIPRALNPKITKRNDKFVVKFLWVKARSEKTLVLPENLIAMILGTKKAQGTISADATISNIYSINIFLLKNCFPRIFLK